MMLLVSAIALLLLTALSESADPSSSSSTNTNQEEMASKCPFLHGGAHKVAPRDSDRHFFPNSLDLGILYQNPAPANPFGTQFDYAAEFKSLDVDAVKKDLTQLMTDSQDWWPADYGHYGPFFIRMAWHAAGTYRIQDGRGGAGAGTLRFAPLNSWPDNGNLDKARRLLWPIKQKYGRKISWADLMILTGNVALESMGFETFGFAGGREDAWEPEKDIYWGPEKTWLADERYSGERKLDNPLGAVQMGLIYVNPEGPNGNPDPVLSARDIRDTFGRMAMNDEETVALIAGGHTFGKAHGNGDASKVGPNPENAPIEAQGFGWLSTHGSGKGYDTITSGLEGAWTANPIKWDHGFFEILMNNEFEQFKSPAGATQWRPKSGDATVPDAHDASKKHLPIMLTSDLALKFDPEYAKISQRFLENPKDFQDAFARAWYKLTHRDMGPHSRLLGSQVPPAQLWQDPVPEVSHPLVAESDLDELRAAIAASGLSTARLVATAWASASTFRQTDKRGGANGARIALAPQKDWAANEPEELAKALTALTAIQKTFNEKEGRAAQISLADLIVFAGGVGVEQAASAAGLSIKVPFTPGRTDATADATDAESFAVLEPTADGFRNYLAGPHERKSEELLIDRAHFLSLTVPQMTALVGGLRSIGINLSGTSLTTSTGSLNNEYFSNLLDISNSWTQKEGDVYEGKDRATGEVKFTATRADLIFGSNSILRAAAEAFSCSDSTALFVDTFVSSWTKVMNLDRFDL